MKTTVKIIMAIVILTMSNYNAKGQCADSSKIYSFVYNGDTYEVIKENKTWIDAAACAVERGGILTEINDTLEQNAIYNELISNANININNTVAPDGGGGSYVWIGGNDLAIEGNWVWDGDYDNNSTQFWEGKSNGNPVGELYNNWGNEPDDFNGQDALGLSLNGWPLGVAGEWNDVDHTNALFYVVEHTAIVGIDDIDLNNVKVFPNPVKDFLIIESANLDLNDVIIFNSLGQNVKAAKFNNSPSIKVDLSDLSAGAYLIKINSISGKSTIRKLLK